ncbi:MAG: extensin family protein [Sulfitobacter sp.]|nr:extensin family protein [Sulfitobacter sp.]
MAAQETPPPETSALPPDKPDPEARLDDLEAETPEDMPRPPPVVETLAESSEDLEACLARLDTFGTVYETLEPLRDDEDQDCGIENPISVSEILPGVEIIPRIELRCETTVAMAEWVETIVLPAADRLEDRGALTALDQGGGYTCRRRNNAPDGKLSEHSFGNAVDIMGFRFAEGGAIAVEPREREGTMAEAFQRTARAGSCLYFTTVLGPGTDAAHADHLHMDVKQRRGGFRLCQ